MNKTNAIKGDRLPTGQRATGVVIPLKNIEFKKRDDDIFSDTKSNRNSQHDGTFTNQFYQSRKFFSPVKHGMANHA